MLSVLCCFENRPTIFLAKAVAPRPAQAPWKILPLPYLHVESIMGPLGFYLPSILWWSHAVLTRPISFLFWALSSTTLPRLPHVVWSHEPEF